jgi:hypothetical protein
LKTPFATAENLQAAAKEEAKRRYKKPTLEETLRRWWEKKYKIPSTHDLFESKCLEDHLVEFYVDHFETNPSEIHRTEEGEYRLSQTGDPYFDKWEEELEKDIDPDLTEMFSGDELEWFKRARLRAQGVFVPEPKKTVRTQEVPEKDLFDSKFMPTFGDD